MYTGFHELMLRSARPVDEVALRHLAALDSAPPLEGGAVLGAVDGRPVAAIGLTDHRVVADPFVPTAAVVGLLQIRANQLAPRAPRARFRRLRRLLATPS